MGATASADLSSEMQAQIAKQLGELYETLKTQGMSEAEMRVQLENKAAELLQQGKEAARKVSLLNTTDSIAQLPIKARRDTGVIKKGGRGIPGLKRKPEAAEAFAEEDEEEEEEEGEEGGGGGASTVTETPAVAPVITPAPVSPPKAASSTAGVISKPARSLTRQQSYGSGAGPSPGASAGVGGARGLPAAGQKANKGAGGGNRRRSFEPDKPKVASIPENQTLGTSQSTPTLGIASLTEAEAVSLQASIAAATSSSYSSDASSPQLETQDHWDSVSQLPYCGVCAMAFKSVSLLDRHIKYSDLHARTVKKAADQLEAAASKQLEEVVDPEVALTLEQNKQVEGRDFKHLYYGSKFFWRSQDNIDFTFFHHVLCDCVEVVAFSVYKNKELNRLYLSYYMITEGLALSRQDDPSGRIPEDRIRTGVTTFILSRLQLESSDSASGLQVVRYVPGGADDFKTPLVDKPLMLVPRPVVHRRNTSSDEVNKKLEELRVDQEALSESTRKAEKIGSFVLNFAVGFIKNSRRLAKMSLPRRRWIMAINRVLQIIGVERMKEVLEVMRAREAAAAAAAAKTNRRARSTPDYKA